MTANGDSEEVTGRAHFRVHREGMLDLWLALGGDGAAFEWMMAENRRTDADTWAQLLAMVREDFSSLMADTNPPCGPEFEALIFQAMGAPDG